MRYRIKSLAVASLTMLSLLAVSMPSIRAEEAGRQRPIFTHQTLAQAWQTAVASRRPMLVMFSTDSCHFCTKMLAETYSHPGVQQMIREHVETVKVNARDYPDVVERLGIRGYPTTLLVSPEGKVMDAIEGFATVKAFTGRLGPLLKTTGYSVRAEAANTRTASAGRVGS